MMPHPKKKKQRHVVVAADDDNKCINDLSTDELANIFGFLPPEDIMRARLNKKMREVAKTTIVPPAAFVVNSVEKYNRTAAMTTALPNLQQITLCALGYNGHKYEDGEDPDESQAVETANCPTHDIEIISNFRRLRILEIDDAPLNGRYPFLFNFPLLQKLTIYYAPKLKWDLDVLVGLPLLEELCCEYN